MKINMANTIYASLGQIFGRGGFVIASMILAGALSVENFASYSYFILTINMLTGLGSFGLSVAAARAYAEIDLKGDPSELIALWLITILAIIAIVGFLYIDPAELIQDKGVSKHTYIVAIVASILGVVSIGAITGMQAFFLGAGSSALSFLLIIGGAKIGAAKGSLEIAVGAIALSLSLKFLIELLVAFHPRLLRGIGKYRANILSSFGMVLGLIGPAALVTVCTSSAAWWVGQIIRDGAGDLEFALFAIGLQWYSLALFIPAIITRVIFADQVKAANNVTTIGGVTQIRLIESAAKYNLASSLIFVVLISVASPYLMFIYGSKYEEEHFTITLFAIAGASYSISNLVGNAFIAERRQVGWMVLTFLWAAILLAVTAILAPLGASGAAIAYLVSGIFLLVAALYFLKRRAAACGTLSECTRSK